MLARSIEMALLLSTSSSFLLLVLAQNQIVGPTVTPSVSIVPGSTSTISIPKTNSINLTSRFISGLPTVTTVPTTTTSAATSRTPEIIFVTASSNSSSSSSSSGGTEMAEVANGKDTDGLSASELGGIIGGCIGGLVVVVLITMWICLSRQKRRRKRDFYAGRDLPFDETTNKSPTTIDPTVYMDDTTIKKYNISSVVEAAATIPHDVSTPPVILSSSPLNRDKSQHTKRLSKYNFLSQALSKSSAEEATVTNSKPYPYF